MIKKQKRLSGRDITKLFEGGKTTGTPFFVARYIRELGSNTRIAVIAPKTVAKKASERNALRRKWYSAVQKLQKTLIFQGGMYALILKSGAKNLTPEERLVAINSFFNKKPL